MGQGTSTPDQSSLGAVRVRTGSRATGGRTGRSPSSSWIGCVLPGTGQAASRDGLRQQGLLCAGGSWKQ